MEAISACQGTTASISEIKFSGLVVLSQQVVQLTRCEAATG